MHLLPPFGAISRVHTCKSPYTFLPAKACVSQQFAEWLIQYAPFDIILRDLSRGCLQKSLHSFTEEASDCSDGRRRGRGGWPTGGWPAAVFGGHHSPG